MTAPKVGVFLDSPNKETSAPKFNSVINSKLVAIELAKAHLETFLTDYVVIGFNRNKEPLEVEDYFNCGSAEVLTKLFELFTSKTEEKILKPDV